MRVFAWIGYWYVSLVSACVPKGSSLRCHGLILLEFSGSLQLQAFCLCLVHPVSVTSYKNNLMPGPRGRPRRGSPWKPRRPSVSPPDSPSICSSPPLQPEPYINPSPTSPITQFNCLAIIPRMLSSSSRLLLALPVAEPAPIPVLYSLRNLGGEPLPPCKPGNTGHPSSDSFNGEQLKESLAILYGLVFERLRSFFSFSPPCGP
jgi:hypothetical protein